MSQSSDPQRRLPVLYSTSESERAARRPFGTRSSVPFVSPYSAQMMGQDGARRGLRGGEPVLKAARAAYLEAEWSGPDDRRLPKGLLKKTEI